jgi:hypothetical protein
MRRRCESSRVGKLEGERMRREETIWRQQLVFENLKAEKRNRKMN